MTEFSFFIHWRSWKTVGAILIALLIGVLYFYKELRDQGEIRSLENRLEQLEKAKPQEPGR